jgi:hypothetical protein
MAFKQTLKTTLLPSIKMVDLFDLDTSKGSTTPSITKDPNYLPDIAQKAGSTTPFVKIGGQIVTNIEAVTIDETGFLPRLTLAFRDSTGEFSGNTYPKKHLLASIYIKSANDNLKPVRADFLITSMKSIAEKNLGGKMELTKNVTYLVSGELFIPRLYNNVARSYPNMTSKEALQEVCNELGLGFFENDYKTTVDSMTWINFNTSPLNFIKHVADHAYLDDDSFFTAFINKELQLGLIEVNTQLVPSESDLTFQTWVDSLQADSNQAQKNSQIKEGIAEDTMVNFLTNQVKYLDKPNYIYEANLISDQGNVLRMSGYKKQITYYDHFEPDEENKKKQFWVVPLVSPGVSDDTLLVPQNEGMTEIGHKKWMNINYGNTHEHWNAARIYNTHNMQELEKLQLRVKLKGINFNVIRGSMIPLLITVKMAEKLRKDANVEENEVNPQNRELGAEALDTQLSGKYYVKGAKYYFDPTDPLFFSTELFLTKREWTPSKTITTLNA